MKINLKEYYPEYYQKDYFVDVPEKVVLGLKELEQEERRWKDKMFYHFSTIYSLDCADGIEHRAINLPISAEKKYQKDITHQRLNRALEKLTPKQQRRIYQHCVLGYSYIRIASDEGCNRNSIKESIQSGLTRLKKLFYLFFNLYPPKTPFFP